MGELPLSGIRVLEIGGYVTAPLASSILAQLGADVTKVENPAGGDPFRKWSNTSEVSPTFSGINHNKSSLAIDIHQAEGLRILESLLRETDVLVDNLRPGSLGRLGLTDECLVELNPHLVRCSITGFGDFGPDRERPGYDTVGQAQSGLLGLLTDLDDPQPMGTSLSDHVTGIVAVIGVLTALYQREVTGHAMSVGTSLLEASMLLLSEGFGRFLASGEIPDRGHRASLAQVYCLVAGDGGPLVIHLSSPEKFWRGVVEGLEAPELLEDPRFTRLAHRRRNHALLKVEFQSRVGRMTREACVARLRANDVPCAPLSTLEDVVRDPQVLELGMIRSSAEDAGVEVGRAGHVALPLRFDGQRPRRNDRPPLLGEDTRAVLVAAGLSPAEIDDLAARGVVSQSPAGTPE